MLRRSRLIGFLAGILLLGGFIAPAQAQIRPRFHPTRILVKPRTGGDLRSFHARHGARLLRRVADQQVEIVEVPAGQVLKMVQEYEKSGEVEFAEPDYIVHTVQAPNDPKYRDGTLWALHNTGQKGGESGADLNAESAWNVSRFASNIVVAIVDTGIRYSHEDLAANLWTNTGEIDQNSQDDDNDGVIDDVHGFNAIDGTGDPWDDDGHGTHVAGIIGAVGNNGKGVVGVAWQVQLMACKFMDSTGEGVISDAVRCIDFARKHGAHIINASWAGTDYSLALRNAINRARTAGIIFVAAAGNEALDIDAEPMYPASFAFDNVVTVAATTRDDLLASYSSFGAARVALAAPGSEIYSTWNRSDRSYSLQSGTSMAAPFVAGAFALAKTYFPEDTYLQTIQRIIANVDPLPSLSGKCSSGGRINLGKALGVTTVVSNEPAHLSVQRDASLTAIQFSLSGDPNAQYDIEVSSDLIEWSTLLTVQASADGSLTFADPETVNQAARYYRARLAAGTP